MPVTMTQLLHQMKRDARQDCEAAQRDYIAWGNALAGLDLLEGKPEDAGTSWQQRRGCVHVV